MKPFIEDDLVVIDMDVSEFGFHGDVVVTRLESMPENFEDWPVIGDACLAYGEASGHAHKLFGDVEVREDPKTKERYFVTKGNVTYLKHQEHKPRGFSGVGRAYKTGIKREFDPFDEIIREVAD